MSGREPRPFLVLGFGSTRDAMSAEALLKDLAVPVVAVPAPREMGPVCGIGLRVEPADADRAKELLERAGIAPTVEVAVEDL